MGLLGGLHGVYRAMEGLCRDNGKGNGNYYV